MSKKGTKMTYPKDSVEKIKDANRSLRTQVKKLKNALREEKKKTRQYEEALAANFEHMTDIMENTTVEEAVNMAKHKRVEPDSDTTQMVREKYRKIFCNKGSE